MPAVTSSPARLERAAGRAEAAAPGSPINPSQSAGQAAHESESVDWPGRAARGRRSAGPSESRAQYRLASARPARVGHGSSESDGAGHDRGTGANRRREFSEMAPMGLRPRDGGDGLGHCHGQLEPGARVADLVNGHPSPRGRRRVSGAGAKGRLVAASQEGRPSE